MDLKYVGIGVGSLALLTSMGGTYWVNSKVSDLKSDLDDFEKKIDEKIKNSSNNTSNPDIVNIKEAITKLDKKLLKLKIPDFKVVTDIIQKQHNDIANLTLLVNALIKQLTTDDTIKNFDRPQAQHIPLKFKKHSKKKKKSKDSDSDSSSDSDSD